MFVLESGSNGLAGSEERVLWGLEKPWKWVYRHVERFRTTAFLLERVKGFADLF